MAQAQNLPATERAATIRALLEKSRRQMEMALPKHLTADRLLRVAMTSIQRTPRLLECTPQSLLACVMTCAQLGLEPDQFLGQAYLVPFWNEKRKCFEAQLIPGYRGYIALARRSGEMQTVSAQVVYSRDQFKIQYGVNDTLEHVPALDGVRGEPIGAYCVMKFKDGAYSFDFMPEPDIEAIARRSKTYDKEKGTWTGPWDTDRDEMRKKTVIKRHAKLAPLSIEFQRAVALEDRAFAGESQADLLLGGQDESGVIDADMAKEALPDPAAFEKSIPSGTDMTMLDAFLRKNAETNKVTVDQVKIEAMKDPVNFWKFFGAWVRQQQVREKRGPGRPPKEKEAAGSAVEEKKDVAQGATPDEMAPGDCPDREGTVMTKAYCETQCKHREGCPVW